MNRPFTTREKVMLVILSLMIIGICYYKFLLEPINDQIEQYNQMAAGEQDIITQNMALIQKKKEMEQELEAIFAENPDPDPIPNYDNSGVLMVEIHSILEGTVDYTLSFSDTSLLSGGYLLRRPLELEFSVDTYSQARSIINRLHDSKNINQISDLSITRVNRETRQTDEDIDTLRVKMVITYFELA